MSPVLPAEIEESPKGCTKLRLYSILASLYVSHPITPGPVRGLPRPTSSCQLSLFLAALDTTIIAQSIPTICADLHSAAGYVWIGSAYLLATAAAGPIWAKCSDIWGRKVVLLLALGAFAAASVVAALSSDMAMLIAARALQGVAAGGLIQLSMIVMADLFSVRERSLYMGYTGFVWALAGSAGPLVGGAFTQAVTWRWCFWINVPLCAVTFGLAFVFLDVNNPRTKLSEGLRAVDWLGTLLVLATTNLILVGLDFGGAIFPWSSPKVVCLVVFGAVAIGFFLFAEHRLAKYPLMPLGVFKTLSNNAAFAIVFAHGMVLIGIEYYMPLYLQSVQQASPIRSGILLLPLIIVQAAVEIIAGYLIHYTGRYIEFMWSGSLLMTLGTGLYIILGADTSVPVVIGLEIVGAFGPALLFQAPVVAIQNTVSQHETAAATSSLLFLRNVAMSLSVAIGGVVFQNSMEARQPSLVAAGISESVIEALSGSEAAANVGIAQTLQDPSQRHVVLEAFAWSIRNMFILYTCLAGTTVIGCVFLKHKNLNTEHTETKTGLQHLTKRRDAKK